MSIFEVDLIIKIPVCELWRNYNQIKKLYPCLEGTYILKKKIYLRVERVPISQKKNARIVLSFFDIQQNQTRSISS